MSFNPQNVLQNARERVTMATQGPGGGSGPDSQRRGVPSASIEEGVSYDQIEAEDFDNTFGSNLTAGVWVDAAEFVCDAQNAYNVGWGMAEFPEVVGRWFMVLDDGSGNAVTGVARIKTRNSNDEQVDTEVRGVPTSRLDTDVSDYRKQYALAEIRQTPKVGEDSKIVLQFKLASGSVGTTIDFTAGATTVLIPVSNYS